MGRGGGCGDAECTPRARSSSPLNLHLRVGLMEDARSLEQNLADSLGCDVYLPPRSAGLGRRLVAVPSGESAGAGEAAPPTPAAGGRSGGRPGRPGSYPRYMDTLGSAQVRVRKFAYPDGGFSGTITRSGLIAPLSKQTSSAPLDSRSPEEQEHRRQDNLHRSIARSATLVKRLVRWHSLTRLMTFTNGAQGIGWDSRKAVLDDVARFLKVHGHECFGSTKVLIVAERGGRGGRWHAHALIEQVGWLPYSRIITRWSEFMENRGHHSLTGTHRWHAGDDKGKHADGFTSARVAARYAAKYLTKDLAAEDYGTYTHRYRTAGGLAPVHPDESHHAEFTAALATLPPDAYTVPITVDLADGSSFLIGYYFDAGGG